MSSAPGAIFILLAVLVGVAVAQPPTSVGCPTSSAGLINFELADNCNPDWCAQEFYVLSEGNTASYIRTVFADRLTDGYFRHFNKTEGDNGDGVIGYEFSCRDWSLNEIENQIVELPNAGSNSGGSYQKYHVRYRAQGSTGAWTYSTHGRCRGAMGSNLFDLQFRPVSGSCSSGTQSESPNRDTNWNGAGFGGCGDLSGAQRDALRVVRTQSEVDALGGQIPTDNSQQNPGCLGSLLHYFAASFPNYPDGICRSDGLYTDPAGGSERRLQVWRYTSLTTGTGLLVATHGTTVNTFSGAIGTTWSYRECSDTTFCGSPASQTRSAQPRLKQVSPIKYEWVLTGGSGQASPTEGVYAQLNGDSEVTLKTSSSC